jgi:MoxR-like ATPase
MNIQLNATNTRLAIKACIALDKPLMIWSGPGIGKSSIMRQIAEEDNAQLVDIRLSMWDSVDVNAV